MEVTHLTPPWCTKTNGKYGEQPCVSLTEVCKNTQQYTPNTNEENCNEYNNLPLGNFVTPQEGPVPSVWLGNRSISANCWRREKANLLH